MADDFGNDTNTSGRLEINDFVRGRIEDHGDRDWFRIRLNKGVTYEFGLEGSDTGLGTLANPYLRIHDANGQWVVEDNDSGTGSNSKLRFQAQYDGFYYLSAAAFADAGFGDYSLHSKVVDDYDNDAFAGAVYGALELGSPMMGAVETGFDRDWFRVIVEEGRTYRFELKGADTGHGTLANPNLRLYVNGGGGNKPHLSDNNGGEGLNSKLEYTADRDRWVYASASGIQAGIGTYTISAEVVDDHSDGPQGATRLKHNKFATAYDDLIELTGDLESPTDEDWFRVTLKKNKSYHFRQAGQSNSGKYADNTLADTHLRLVDRNGNEVASHDGSTYSTIRLHRAAYTGNYYLVAGTSEPDAEGTYHIRSDEFTTPKISTFARDWRMPPGTERNIGLEDRYTYGGGFRFRSSDIRGVEIYHDADDETGGYFKINDERILAGRVYQVSEEDAKTLTYVAGGADASDFDQIYVRINDAGTFTAWEKMSLWTTSSTYTPPDRDQQQTGYLTYSFMNALPSDYSAQDAPGFRALSVRQVNRVRDAINAYADRFGLIATEVANTEDAKMRVFAADLDEDYAYTMGPGFHSDGSADDPKAFDVILNHTRAGMQDLTAGGYDYFRLLRTLGDAMGVNNDLSRLSPDLRNYAYTIMSDRAPKGGTESYPISPMLYDAPNTGVIGNKNDGNTVYRMTRDRPEVQMINDFTGQNTIDASDINTRVHIDLRPSQLSWAGNGRKSHVFSYRHGLQNGIGGRRADMLIGNSIANELAGGRGNDKLQGREGNDRLMGGHGNDLYQYELGDGDDTIFDTRSKGNDVLQIRSPLDLNSLQGDLEFRRDGKDLIVDLEFNRQENVSQGSIRIEKMSNKNHRVETLRLIGHDGQAILPDISLVSIYQQTTADGSRFRLTSGSDAHGRLVSGV